MLDTVEVVSVEDGGFYQDAYTSGSTVDVVLKRGNEFAKCEGILIFEEQDDESMFEYFEEWKQMAQSGEDGYSYWIE